MNKSRSRIEQQGAASADGAGPSGSGGAGPSGGGSGGADVLGSGAGSKRGSNQTALDPASECETDIDPLEGLQAEERIMVDPDLQDFW